MTIEALKIACEHLGLVFEEGKTEHKWFGSWQNDYAAADAAYKQGIKPEDYGRCLHVIRLKYTPHQEEEYAAKPETRPYEIGVVQMPDGQLGLIMDHWSGGKGTHAILGKLGGKEFPKLLSGVSENRILMTAAQQTGHKVKRIERLTNGKTKIVLSVKAREKL